MELPNVVLRFELDQRDMRNGHYRDDRRNQLQDSQIHVRHVDLPDHGSPRGS